MPQAAQAYLAAQRSCGVYVAGQRIVFLGYSWCRSRCRPSLGSKLARDYDKARSAIVGRPIEPIGVPSLRSIEPMDRNTFLGGSPLGVFIRLVLLSIVVGVILSAVGITPRNFFYQIEVLLRRIYDLGFETFDWVLEYLLLGAMVVVPIWLIARLISTLRRSKDTS
jgi:hypothetical protein